jgi:hypothetical protein
MSMKLRSKRGPLADISNRNETQQRENLAIEAESGQDSKPKKRSVRFFLFLIRLL